MTDSDQTDVSSEEVDNRTIRLDPSGDAVLLVQADASRRFLVSSRTLCLASKYFAALFGSSFAEGQAVRRCECPQVVLKEDDPEAMDIILSILHYRFLDSHWTLDPEVLAKVALHSDKYQCSTSLQPWISQWMQNMPEPSDSEGFGLVLTAAYLFRIPRHIETTSIAAIRNVPIEFRFMWGRYDIIQLLPRAMQSKIEVQIMDTLEVFRDEIESMEGLLRDQSASHTIHRGRCPRCGRSYSPGVMQCQHCRNKSLFPEMCTPEKRVADYFSILRRGNLWPVREPFEECSITEIAARFEALTKDTEHKCDGGSKCPLKEQIQELYNRVCSTMQEIQGIKFEPDVQDPCGQGEGEASDSPIKTLAVSDSVGE